MTKRVRLIVATAWLAHACLIGGCSKPLVEGATSPPTGVASGARAAPPSNVVETIALHGFEDSATNEPEIRRASDGSLLVVFNCMPPCFEPKAEEWYESLGPYAHFDVEMQQAIGADVFWEDREVFRIRTPKDDTVTKVRQFVAQYRERRRAVLGGGSAQ